MFPLAGYSHDMKANTSPWLTILARMAVSPAQGSQAGRKESVLPKGRLLTFDGGHDSTEIRCIKGCLWMTQESDSGDTILRSGESARAKGTGRVVVEALENAIVSM